MNVTVGSNKQHEGCANCGWYPEELPAQVCSSYYVQIIMIRSFSKQQNTPYYAMIYRNSLALQNPRRNARFTKVPDSPSFPMMCFENRAVSVHEATRWTSRESLTLLWFKMDAKLLFKTAGSLLLLPRPCRSSSSSS